MKKLIKLNFPLIGKAEIVIYDEKLAEFAIRQLKNYIEQVVSYSAKKEYKSVISVENQELTAKFNKISKTNREFSSNAKLEKGILSIIKDSKFLETNQQYYIEKNKLIIKSKKRFKYNLDVLKKGSDSYGFYHQLFYDLILFPIFSLYSLIDGYYLIHGSLAQVNEKTIILCGLDGVGKSSISQRLLEQGHKVYSDNFVLFNGSQAVGFSLPIRLEANTTTNLTEIYKDKKLKELLLKDIIFKSVKVDQIFILTISEELNLLKLNKNNMNLNSYFISNGAAEISSSNTACVYSHFMNLFSMETSSIKDNPDYYILEIPKSEIDSGIRKLNF